MTADDLATGSSQVISSRGIDLLIQEYSSMDK